MPCRSFPARAALFLLTSHRTSIILIPLSPEVLRSLVVVEEIWKWSSLLVRNQVHHRCCHQRQRQTDTKKDAKLSDAGQIFSHFPAFALLAVVWAPSQHIPRYVLPLDFAFPYRTPPTTTNPHLDTSPTLLHAILELSSHHCEPPARRQAERKRTLPTVWIPNVPRYRRSSQSAYRGHHIGFPLEL